MIRRTITNAILLSLLLFLPIASLRAADSKGNDLLQMVVELLGEKDKDFRAAGLDQVRNGAEGFSSNEALCGSVAQARSLGPGGSAQCFGRSR